MTTQTILSIQHLTKHFGKHLALDDFNLEVKRGDILGIAGRNGAGKTTLLRLITGLSSLEKGSIQLFGSVDEKGLAYNRRYIGAIIESPAFIPEMTAEQNLRYYSIQRGLNDNERIAYLLELVELHHAGKKKFKDFSLGMKQRLSVAAALLHQPNLLILDEPTNGLDPAGIIQMRELLLKLARETQLTILVSSHILSELEHLATRFVIIDNGKKVSEFTKEELYQQTQNYYDIHVNDVKKATALLEQVFHTTNYGVTEHQTLKVYDLNIPLHTIATAFVQEGLELHHLTLKQHQLETLYLDLIQGGHNND